MARHEEDREDLLAEATALVPRAELRLPGEESLLVVGWRREGRRSLYFGPDRVYHFDAAGRLRKAYVEGYLFRSQGTTLARLLRNRTSTETQLLRHDLDAGELTEFLATMRAHLQNLLAAIDRRAVEIVRVVPAGAEILERLASAVRESLAADPPLARRMKK